MTRRIAGLFLMAFAALSLAACGVKGPLEAPTSSATTAEGGQIIEGNTTEETPRKRIILDGLLD